MVEIQFIGDIDNWMDMRDYLIYAFQSCDTQLKFNKLYTGIALSLVPSPEVSNELRKSLGLKKLSKKDMEKFRKWSK